MFQLTKDSYAKYVSGVFAATSVVIVCLIFFFLFQESKSSVGFSRFIFDIDWLPEPSAADGAFGIRYLIAGSFLTSLLALVVALPIGILSAISIVFYSSRKVSKFLKISVELLAGIPSVVFGLWGLVFLVPIMQSFSATGLNMLTASLVLSMMIVPTIILTSVSSLRNADEEVVVNAEALGLSKEAKILNLVLPIAVPGLSVGTLLSFARAIGETMVVVMLCGNIVKMPDSVVDSVRALTANIALEMSYAYGDHRSALFFTAFLLMLLVSLLLLVIEFMKRCRR